MSNDDAYPIDMSRLGNGSIVIEWSDQSRTTWSPTQLRALCPCANCREIKDSGPASSNAITAKSLPVLSAAEARPLQIEAMNPVGNYAYQLRFSDGHSSGIYPFSLLRGNG